MLGSVSLLSLRRLCRLPRNQTAVNIAACTGPRRFRGRTLGPGACRRCCSSTTQDLDSSSPNLTSAEFSDHLEFSPSAAVDVGCFRVLSGFATSEDEMGVVKEAKKAFRGKKYQYDHWDKAIVGYRETEKLHWVEPTSVALIERLRAAMAAAAGEGVELETIQEIHVLDLAADGEIKPHIDSVKFCGDVIAGVSLLSACVMRLEHEEDPGKWIQALLPRHSLYIMSGAVRYKYTHAIPKGEQLFRDKLIERQRRLSLICRAPPR